VPDTGLIIQYLALCNAVTVIPRLVTYITVVYNKPCECAVKMPVGMEDKTFRARGRGVPAPCPCFAICLLQE